MGNMRSISGYDILAQTIPNLSTDYPLAAAGPTRRPLLKRDQCNREPIPKLASNSNQRALRCNTIQEKPIHRDLKDHLRELHRVCRFFDKAVSTERIALFDLLFIFTGCEHDNGQASRLDFASNALENLETTQLG